MSVASTKLAKLEAQRAALDLRIRAASTKEKERRRREDTRGKIVLGGALLALFRSEPVIARALMPKLLQMIAGRDREQINCFKLHQLALAKGDDC
ncbi:MAG: hypothetical protein Q8J92_02670 [Parvibaculum sp.]|nr:hypothetical protein [Parvibaculum sp.]